MPSIEVELPHELLELIFDHILRTKTGRRTLGSCLLVSKDFCQLTRSRLFGHLEVDPYNDRKVNGLRKLLEHGEEEEGSGLSDINCDKTYPVCGIHASLILYIKSFKFIWPPGTVTIVYTPIDHSDYMEDVGAILLMFAKSQTIQALEIDFLSREPPKFPDLNKRHLILIMQSLRKILDSPSLESLTLSNLSSVPHDTFDIWRLKHLTLLDVSVSERSWFEFFQDAQPSTLLPRPTNLYFQSFTYTFHRRLPSQWLNSPSAFSHLLALTAKFDYPDHAVPNITFDSFLKLSGESLHSLHIDLDNVSTTPFTYIFDLFPHNLKNLTALRLLKFTVYSFFHLNSEGDGVIVDHDHNQLVPSLSTNAVRSSNMKFGRTGDVVRSLDTFDLEKVPDSLHTIEVEFYARKARVEGVRFRKETDWQELGNKLMESRFGSVKNIGISLVVEIKTAALGESLDVAAPFLKEFPDLWMDRYPSIPIKVVKVEMWKDSSM
ncbi:hypothetical protein CPB83DRAFT_900432 [Crepidotus variabilis]|uniref:Uncharacterized protein n=1 Tax=Crepidotus variabilis TaxID=179855 RepID=A0A9P6E373_9AGAR|nr:hypothetical protein CPB83DRAFT_900432 [Crepidotus variabilis]